MLLTTIMVMITLQLQLSLVALCVRSGKAQMVLQLACEQECEGVIFDYQVSGWSVGQLFGCLVPELRASAVCNAP